MWNADDCVILFKLVLDSTVTLKSPRGVHKSVVRNTVLPAVIEDGFNIVPFMFIEVSRTFCVLAKRKKDTMD